MILFLFVRLIVSYPLRIVFHLFLSSCLLPAPSSCFLFFPLHEEWTVDPMVMSLGRDSSLKPPVSESLLTFGIASLFAVRRGLVSHWRIPAVSQNTRRDPLHIQTDTHSHTNTFIWVTAVTVCGRKAERCITFILLDRTVLKSRMLTFLRHSSLFMKNGTVSEKDCLQMPS